MVADIKESIMETMNALKSGVSFVDFENNMTEKGISFNGTWAVCMPKNKNVFMWADMSEEYVTAIKELVFDELKIRPVLASPWIYIADGKMPSLPIAKNINRQYKTERWSPTVFELGSLKDI